MSTVAASFERLYGIIARLRAPDGCPWDREQTPESMRANLIEEAYEAVEAIQDNDPAHTREELGDVFMLATMISYMYEQEGSFSVADSIDDTADKLVRRHPHVFGDSNVSNSEDVVRQWDEIKVKVEGRKAKDSVLDSVSRSLPPLERAFKIQKKAAKVGFDWPDVEGAWAKVHEEIAEVRELLSSPSFAKSATSTESADAAESAEATKSSESSEAAAAALEDEIGDLLFAAINVSRHLHVDPSLALNRAVQKFETRFRHVEKSMKDSQTPMDPDHFEEMDRLWDEAKAGERARVQ